MSEPSSPAAPVRDAPVAVLDANVLYSATLRHLIIHVAIAGAFRAHWTDILQDEWTRSLVRDRPDLDARKINHTRQLMDAYILGALVCGYEAIVETLELPDPDDRHVLAAAIHCGATIIVTVNKADFPASTLAALQMEAMSPDEFVCHLLDIDPQAVVAGARSHRADLKNPTRVPAQYLAGLASKGLSSTAAALSGYLSEL